MSERITAKTSNKLIDQFLEVDGWYEVASVNATIRDRGFREVCREIREASKEGTLVWSAKTLSTPDFTCHKAD